MLEFLTQSTWADRIGWVLVHSLWQFALVAVLAVALQWALKRCSASTRYRALLAAMCILVAGPVATWFSPWVADATAVAANSRPVEKPAENPPSRHDSPSQHGDNLVASRAMPSESLPKHAAKPQSEPRRVQPARVSLASSLSLVERTARPWLPEIVLVWFVGVLVAALRPLLSWYTVRQLRTVGVSRVGEAASGVAERAAKRLGLAQAVEVVQSTLIRTPVVIGYFRPAVLLPLCVVTGVPEAQLDLILAHELAHVRRHDYLINFFQTLIETLFFYHPAVWWLSRQIRNERENCCDDVAMAAVGSRSDYGRALLAVEELRAASTAFSLAACGGSLLARIRRIAGCEPAPRVAGGGSILCVILTLIAIFAAVAWAAIPMTEKPEQVAAATAADANGRRPSADANAGAWQPGQILDFRVVNARTKEPLSGVKLELQYHGKGIDFQDVKIQTTDTQGRSEIILPNLRPDAVRVYPSKAGFVPLRVYWGDDLPSPKLPKAVTVPLEPGTVWGGVVRNEQGEPIPGAKVTIHYWESPGGNPQPHRRANIDEETTTDEDGRWRVDVMPDEVVEDDVRIFLSHPDYVSDHLRRGMIPIPVTERPSLEDLRAQTAVMIMHKGGVIKGRVTDAGGRPIAGVPIYNEEYYWFDSRKPAATTDEDGRFQIANVSFAQSGINDPPPSTIRAIERHEVALTVQAPGYTPELIHTDPNGSASPLEVSLKPGQAVQGSVVDESGRPIEGVSVSVSNWLGYRERLNLATKTDADGRFRLSDAPSGGALYDFIKKGYIAVQDFPMSPQRTGQPEKEGYQVTLQAPLQVAGLIVDAETNRPLAKCTVIKGVEYDDGRAPEWQRLIGAKTIGDGRYEYEFASKIFSWRMRVEAEGYMPAVSRIFRPGGPDKGLVTYDFKLSKAPPLTGSVLGPDGRPLAGAEVFLATTLLVVNDGKASSGSRRSARTAQTDAAGRFELPPEVEPFYLVALHDQGFAVLTETEFAKSSTVRIKPWTAENRSFRAERRPSTGRIESPAANAEDAFAIRVVDEEGKPVEGAHVATYIQFRVSPNQFVPYESGWNYFPNVLSDGEGMARIVHPHSRCIVARHVERKLVGIQSLGQGRPEAAGIKPDEPGQTETVTLTMHPQCTVSGRLTAKELEARNRAIAWSNVYVYLDDGMGPPMSCMSERADFRLYLPPGTFTLEAYARDTEHVRKTVTVEPGREKLDVEPIDLPPEGLVLLEGKPAPELRDVVAWRNGGPINLSDLRGKVVILSFSMQWSGGRLHSRTPELVSLYDKYHDQGVVIVDVRLLGVDSNATLEERVAEIKKPFWKDRDLPIPIALVPMNPVSSWSSWKDAKGKSAFAVLEDYGLVGIPTNVLIDRQGRVVGRFDPQRKAANLVLEEVLKEKRADALPDGLFVQTYRAHTVARGPEVRPVIVRLPCGSRWMRTAL